MKKYLYGALLAGLTPVVALAQTQINEGGILGVMRIIQRVLDFAVILIISLAIVYFLWNVVKYIQSGGDPDGRTKARTGIIYSLIGIAVMVSVWGLVRILQSTFITGDTNSTVTTPSLPRIN